jgi:hypothetical protein
MFDWADEYSRLRALRGRRPNTSCRILARFVSACNSAIDRNPTKSGHPADIADRSEVTRLGSEECTAAVGAASDK